MNNFMFPIPPINNNYYYNEEIKNLYIKIKQLEERVKQLENANNNNDFLKKDDNYQMI